MTDSTAKIDRARWLLKISSSAGGLTWQLLIMGGIRGVLAEIARLIRMVTELLTGLYIRDRVTTATEQMRLSQNDEQSAGFVRRYRSRRIISAPISGAEDSNDHNNCAHATAPGLR